MFAQTRPAKIEKPLGSTYRLNMGANQSSVILHRLYLTLIRPRMSFPTDILGLFQEDITFGPMTPYSWERLLLVNDSSQCYIDRVLFCKCDNDKQHEFLLIYVRHPTSTAKALLAVDRSHAAAQKSNSSLQSLAPGLGIISPSCTDILAQDRIYVTRENNIVGVTKQYKPYTMLCQLTFPPPSKITGSSYTPSVRQLCVLLKVVNEHAPFYNLYENQCYWFANTVFDMLKKLFPDGNETCTTQKAHSMRSEYLGFKFEPHRSSVEKVSGEYYKAWNEACEKVKREEMGREEHRRQLIEQGRKEGREEGRAERAQLEARLREYESCHIGASVA